MNFGSASVVAPCRNTQAIAQPELSIDQAFMIALTFAINECINNRPSWGDSTTMYNSPAHTLAAGTITAVENLKNVARNMHAWGNDYANWLESRVREFALRNPLFRQTHSVDLLRWIFSPSLFDDELRKVPLAASQIPLRATTADFVPDMVSSQHKAMVSKPQVVSDPLPMGQEGMSLFYPIAEPAMQPTTPQQTFIAQDHVFDHRYGRSILEPFGTYTAPFATPPRFESLRRSPTNPAKPKFVLKTPPISLGNTVAPPDTFRSSFQPSRELLGLPHVPSPKRVRQALEVGMSRNPQYRGDLTELDISNSTCPPELNCAIRIENISCYATDAEIFSKFIEGKVFSFSKKDPVPGRFRNCAARLVFTTRAAAEAFIARGQSREGIVLHGDRFHVKWNRDACRPVRDGEHHQSRVIRIMGPKNELCAAGVEEIFHTHIKFKLVESKEWMVDDSMKMVELSFCSILGQARIAYKFFHEYMECWNLKGFSIGFGPDPCEPAVPLSFPTLPQP